MVSFLQILARVLLFALTCSSWLAVEAAVGQGNSFFRSIKSKVHGTRANNSSPAIAAVTIQGAVALPLSAVKSALQQCGLVGSQFSVEKAAAFRHELNRWYENNDYPFSQVSELSEQPSSDGQLIVQVQEPLVAAKPVILHYFCFGKNKTESPPEILPSPRSRTRPETVAYALGLRPGAPFKWSANNVARLRSSGLFADMTLRNTTTDSSDGGVCIHLDVVEKESYVFFEPEVGFADRTLCGDVTFRHDNLLGLNQKLALNARYNPASLSPQGSIQYENDRFGRCGGISFKMFQSPGPSLRHHGSVPGAAKQNQKDESEEERRAFPTTRRGAKGKLRLTDVAWGSTSVGAKVESIKQCANNDPAASPRSDLPVENIRALQAESTAKFMSEPNGLRHNIGATLVGGISRLSLSTSKGGRGFISSVLTSRSVFPVKRTSGGEISSVHFNTMGVVQSSYLPAHERQRLLVRGANDPSKTFKTTPAWVSASIEHYTPLPGGLTSFLFLDVAQASPFTQDCGSVVAVGSCGVGVLVGPIKIELVRHQARNRIMWSTR